MNWVIFIKTKPTTKPITISFSTFSLKELDAVLEIEQLAYDFPWRRTQFVDSLNNPQTQASLMRQGDKIRGYALLLRVLDSADLLNICIHPEYQHQGLGAQFLTYLLQKLQNSGVKTVLIEVRMSNRVARNLYQKFGFEAVAVRKKYYSNGEDAKILRLQLR